MSAGTVKVKGVPVTFDTDTTLIVPPIALGDLEQLEERLKAPNVTTMIDAVHAALRRNYPDMTREDVGRLVDTVTVQEAFGAAMSGQKRAASSGEALAPSTGADSTPG